MNEPAKFNSVVSFLWAIADLLNGAFKKSEFQKIILPFTVLRRLDYALEKTKAKVLETEHKLKEKGLENRHGQLCRAAGYAFYNTSKFNYESLLHDDANLALNLRQYVMGFSPNVREIFAAFNFDDTIRDLSRVDLLYLLMERFNERSKVDLRPASMSNHEMGYVFEHLLRKFNEALNENPGEHFTPRDAIRLMVDLVLMLDTELSGAEGVTRTVNDCGCGTGGILSITKEHILQINPQAKVFLYGQELNPFTWAIARADMLILEPEGKDAENIKLGSTLSNDQFSGQQRAHQKPAANPNGNTQSDGDSVLPSSKPENQGETVDNPGTALARKQLRPYVEITAFREYLKEQIVKWETWHQSQVDEIRMHESCRDHAKEQLENGIRQGTVDPDDPDDICVLSYEWHKYEVTPIPKDFEFRLVAEGEPICFQEASIAAMVALFWCDINRKNMLVPEQPDFDFLDPYGTFQKYLFEQWEKPIQGRYKHIDWFVEAAINLYESKSEDDGVGEMESGLIVMDDVGMATSFELRVLQDDQPHPEVQSPPPTTPPPTTTPLPTTPPTPTEPPISAIALAKLWLDKPRTLGGPTNDQKTFITKLTESDGMRTHADLSCLGEFDWRDHRKGATNMAKRINKRLSEYAEAWSVIPEDNSRCLIVLNSELGPRS